MVAFPSCPRYVRHVAVASSYGRLEAERVNQFLMKFGKISRITHDNGRCLATVHCIFSSYGRLQAERVNQF